jgi:hypothetical protein
MSAPFLPPRQSKTFLPSSTPIIHIPWRPGVDDHGNPVLDAHGNPTGSYAAPVNRVCICWWPLERRTWQIDPVDPDVVARIESDIHILVDDVNPYNKFDQVQVNVSSDSAAPQWLTYRVEGLPTNWASALPFPAASYGMLIGGELHCRRVTSTGVLAGQ